MYVCVCACMYTTCVSTVYMNILLGHREDDHLDRDEEEVQADDQEHELGLLGG